MRLLSLNENPIQENFAYYLIRHVQSFEYLLAIIFIFSVDLYSAIVTHRTMEGMLRSRVGVAQLLGSGQDMRLVRHTQLFKDRHKFQYFDFHNIFLFLSILAPI